jgi:hypothetical protein
VLSNSHISADSAVQSALATYNQGTDMREHVLLFCLLGLVFTVTIILVTAPGAVTWAVALIE